MSLVVFQKWSKMSQNFHKADIFGEILVLKKLPKKIPTNQGNRSRRADSENMVSLWSWGNIFEKFGLKTHLLKNPKNCHISPSVSRKTVEVMEEMRPKVTFGG